MVLDLIITFSDDGCTAEIPSIKGCESWAHDEESVLDKTIELLRFFLQVDSNIKIKTDLARKENNIKIYKVIFNK